MPIVANCAYVIPPERDVVIQDSRLKLVPRTTTRGLHMPIDYFLRTLADAQKGMAIAVILSGTGQDGTLGLKAASVGTLGIASPGFARETTSWSPESAGAVVVVKSVSVREDVWILYTASGQPLADAIDRALKLTTGFSIGTGLLKTPHSP